MVQCAKEKLPLFTKPLSALENHLLLMGSEGDDMCRADFQDEYRVIARETNADICIFRKGYILQSSPVRRRLQRPFRDSWKNKNHKEAGR